MRQASLRLRLSVPGNKVIYLVNHESFVASDRSQMGAYWEGFFSLLSRNALNASHSFMLPAEQVVELGSRIDL